MIAIRRAATLISMVASALALSLASLTVWAQADQVNVSYLQGLLPKADGAVTTLGPDLMGDKVNLFNGALEFEHTDVSLPGNSALPVAITRRHVAGRTVFIRGTLGDWDLETPRIAGVFATATGWVNGTNEVTRCSSYTAPPVQYRAATGGGGGAAAAPAPAPSPASGPTARLPAGGVGAAAAAVTFYASDYWQGTFLHIPGAGAQEIFVRRTDDGFVPTDNPNYRHLTKSKWHFRCLDTVQNAAGEGFIAISPEGVTYRFDWMASRLHPAAKREGASLARREYMLMATEVTDRFGKKVTYTYSAAAPERLTSVQATDGRQITLGYDASGRVSTVNDGTRAWTYAYDANGHLTTVTRPDNSRWQFNLRPLVHLNSFELGELASCESSGYFPESDYVGTITHPSGAVGTFTLKFQQFNRSNVTKQCLFVGTKPVNARWPKSTTSQALKRKHIGGPGLPAGGWGWDYTYTGGAASWAPCNPCADTRTVEVKDPSAVKTRHTFGVRYQSNEGQLQIKEEGIPAQGGAAGLRSTSYRYRQSRPWLEPMAISINQNSDYLSNRHRPEDLRATTQQATTFRWEVASAGFDSEARVLEVRRVSTPGFTRTDRSTYEDNRTRWVIGQLKSLTESTTGLAEQLNDYDPLNGLRTAKREFGRLVESYTYHTDGNLWQRKDPLGRATTFTDYYRGIARSVTGRDGFSESAAVNALGQITSYTNEAGTTTTYGYDAMGRLASIGYPPEAWGSYYPTTISFSQVQSTEYGIAPGHWRQIISTGNAHTIRYFDALWNVRLAAKYDNADAGNTSSFVETRYDFEGHKTFESYPLRTFYFVDGPAGHPPVLGRRWQYDGLDRVTREEQDSELPGAAGVLATTTTYSTTEFTKVVANPRGHATTHKWQAFDTPSEATIASLTLPEGVSVAIARDVFGKARQITRSGTYLGVSQSASRSYLYDPHQRLCKTVEPETGATIQAYDGAGNIAWRASGQPFTGLTSCDDAAVPTAAKITYGYDAEDRLATTSYGDGSAGITRTYTRDGLLEQLNSGPVNWTYRYNNRRLMDLESLVFNGGTYPLTHGIDAYGNRESLTYPDGQLVSRSLNALGQPRAVGSGVASGVTFHPNGQLAGYTAGNGVGVSISLNTRGLPLTWQHGSVLHDVYSYDANGNVAQIGDLLTPAANRSMGYDGLDRLSAASGIWGAGSFGYDALDNLRTSVLGSRSVGTTLDAATHRITQLTVNGAATALSYDANGNLRTRGAQQFTFDIGNRLQQAIGKARYTYDGHGRRTVVAYDDGSWKFQVYGSDGKLMYSLHPTRGATNHIYLGGRLIAEQNSVSGRSYVHADALGSPVVRTDAMGREVANSRTRYEPYGGTVAGSANPDGVGFTGHVNDVDTGLVYMQQRYYDPLAGRFLSVDPVTTDSGSGQHFNRYVYALNNPYNYNDPDGRLPNFVLGALVGAGIEAVVQYRTTGSVKAAGVIGAAVAGAITGGMSGMLSKGVVQNVISAGTATGKTALVGAASGVVGKHVEGAISGKTPSGTDLAVAAAGGALGAGAGAKITNSAVGAVQAEAAKAGVAGHIGQTTMNAIATGGPAAVRSSAGQEIAKTGIEAGTAYAGEKLKQASQ
ncbi:MAG: hypothetical protein JNJ89_17335 [Rubrivivax sp.]|nr:hypothetical protein [Rubrivivax sp.]